MNLNYAKGFYLDKYGAGLFGIWDLDSFYDSTAGVTFPFQTWGCLQIINGNSFFMRFSQAANLSTFT